MKREVVKVKREKLKACMTCPICDKLINQATTISLCLHTFCRKCIYRKLSDEEADCCPICYTDLGCIPVEKLRPDHNLQDLRAKIFPSKRIKIDPSEVMPSNSLPLKRKERSLSSLVVSTPKVSIQAGLTGKRTKSAGRKATGLRGTSFTMKESIKKEEDAVENFPQGSQSPGSLNEFGQDVKQTSKRDLEGNVDLWKPLNCLVEAANRTKTYKVNSQGSCLAKLEPLNADDGEKHLLINKVKEINHKYKDFTTMVPVQFKHKRLRVLGRKSGGVGFPAMSQAVIDYTVAKQSRRNCPFWFSLVASEPQRGNVPLPQISSCYLRIKDGNLPVSFIHKYLMKKLDLASESESQGTEISHSAASGDRETGKGINQIGTLQRAGTTRWSSHFNSICSLIDMYGAIITVLESINNDKSISNSVRGEARGSLKALKSFKFLFVLHLMHKIMGITDLLCRALQSKSIDILNAMDLVATTKELLQSLRDNGFDVVLHCVNLVCEKFMIDVPDMSARYMDDNRSVRQKNDISVEHYYHYNLFNSAIDFQLNELHLRFNDAVVELLKLSSALEPKNNFEMFDIDRICTLASSFYPDDFNQQDMYYLRLQLEHYKIDLFNHEKFQNLLTVSELCR